MAGDYRDLRVWQRATDLVVMIYAATRRFPREERFGLSAQMRRAAVSVAANIAEGNSRLHRGEYIHHASVARGSLSELRTHLELARRLELIDPRAFAECENQTSEVIRLLQRLITRLRE